MDSYKTILNKYNISFDEKSPWLICGKTNLIQGWKLHVSSMPNEIDEIYNIICPYLNRNSVVFKIIANETLCVQLNSGELGQTQIGKTMTIYPEDYQTAKNIIEFIKAKTDFKFTGPRISTDVRLGSILYCRYGGYNPIIEYDRFGRKKLMIYDPYNNLIEDNYTTHLDLKYYKFPFEDFKFETAPNNKNKLLLDQYLVLDVLKSDPKGNVFRALDVSNKKSIKPVVLKQGVAHMLSDTDDRDIINRLKSQFQICKKIKNVNIPIPYDLRKCKENYYLITEYIEGENLENKVFELLKMSTFKFSDFSVKSLLISYAIQLIEEVIKLHDQGIVHRDLSASNVLISAKNRVYLSDFELAYDTSRSQKPFKGGTEGFMSNQQKNNQLPTFKDDTYSVSAIMILIFTGLDPRRVVKGDLNQVKKRLLYLAGTEIEFLLDDLLSCFNPEDSIPSLLSLKSKLEQLKFKKSNHKKIWFTSNKNRLTATIINFSNSLVSSLFLSNDLWFSESLDKNKHMGKIRSSDKTFYGSLNRGVSGVLYVLAHLVKSGFTVSNTKIIDNSIVYLKKYYDVDQNKDLLPGLHFGTAGIAVSIAYGISSGILPKSKDNLSYIKKSLQRSLDWSDYTHGAAGQGMACLKTIELLGFDKEIEWFLEKCFNYLKDAQKENGSWVIEEGVEGISGETMYGFAHGVAGIANFFLSYYQYTKEPDALERAEKTAEWLFQSKKDNGKHYSWSFSKTNNETWNWWCHGATGISIFFLNLYAITNNKKYLDVVIKSLSSLPPKPNFSNFSLCHGLSGVGEVWLHAYSVTQDKIFLERAGCVAETLLSSYIKDGKNMYWLTENPDYPTADFFVGNGGILYFLIDYYNTVYKKAQVLFPIT
ncbi:lanthionine synthetase LanC family protein [Ascidiimonas aurantiaca]|uniref:lanthionine synthetase LanC family protein n=1 Tax=Ascidiimonas aurantiaca TaxID=1685432 RepID=UPI0030EC9417